MKHIYLSFVLAILLPAFCLAQNNFKPGYVVSLKGDTLKGSIDYRERNDNPTSVKFRATDGTITTYTVENSRAFGIDNLEYFEKATLSLSTDDVEFSKLKNSLDSSAVYNTVFLKVITGGKYLTLYSYRDEIKMRFVVGPKGGAPAELSHHVYLRNNSQQIQVNGFRMKLAEYVKTYGQNDEALLARAQNADYDIGDLTKIVNLINGENIKKGRSKAHSGSRYFAGIAMNMSSLKYTGYTDLAYNSENYVNYIPQLNFGVDYLQNTATGNLIFRAEFSLYTATVKAVSANAEKRIPNFTAGVKPQFIYNFYNTDPLKIFFGAGFNLNFTKSGTPTYTVTNPHYTVSLTPKKFNGLWYTVPVKIGAVINHKIELFGSYSFPASVDEDSYSSHTGKISSIQAGVNFLFGKY